MLLYRLTVRTRVSFLLKAFALLAIGGENVLVQGTGQNDSESFVGNNFFLGIPLAPAGQAPVFDITIGTPFDQADYVIESSDGQIASGTVTSGNPAVVRVNSSYLVTSSDFVNRVKGIRVRTTSLNQIYVLVVTMYNDFGFYRSLIGYGSYLVHPNNEYPTDNYVYFAVSFESTPDRNDIGDILLIGNHNETSVSITPAQDVILPADAQSNSSLVEVAAGTTHNVTLNSFQTLGFSTVLDLTGTKIVSDKPLTVITGHQCAQIPSTTGFCEPLYIHLPPTINWGRSFLMAPFGGRTADQYYKLVISVDSTTIHYRCGSNDSVSLERLTAGSGHLLSFSGDSYCYLNASSPVFLVQMSPGSLTDSLGDPALAIVPPTRGHVKSASFLNFPSDFPNSFITVTVLAEHFITSQILFDGNTLACSWNAIRNTFSDEIVGYGCTYRVSNGTHVVTHSGDDGVLSVVAYGWNDRPSIGYAYLTNFNFNLPVLDKVPDKVTDLRCPASGSAAVLLIIWTQPNTNADSVHGYTVQVQKYMQVGRELVPHPLDPPFEQQLETLETSVVSGVEGFLPYSVTVTTRNIAGYGLSISIDCFTQEGVPTVSPAFVSVTHSEENPSERVVTWQPLTLLEARGFIVYLIQLYEVGSVKREVLSLTVPMDQDNATFSDLDTTANYEVSVGTLNMASGDIGPVSVRVAVTPAPTSSVTSTTLTTVTEPPSGLTDPQIPIVTIIIALCVAVVVVVAMVLITIIVIVVIRSRHSDKSKKLMSPSDSVFSGEVETKESHDYEYISKYAESAPLPLIASKHASKHEISINRNPAYATTQGQRSAPLPQLPLKSDTDEISINNNPAYTTTQGQRSDKGVMETVYEEIICQGERSTDVEYDDVCMY